MGEINKPTILVIGGTGLVGKALVSKIDNSKYSVYILSRSVKSNAQDGVKFVDWQFLKSYDSWDFKPDYIVNLSGAGIADSRWTEKRKNVIIRSRVDGNKKVLNFIQRNDYAPKAYISASAIGFYGDRNFESLNEDSNPGQGFLTDSCISWENAAATVGQKCQRMVILRIGIVMTSLGGALKKMLMTKLLRILNYFGNGQQIQSWIHIDDLCGIILYAIENQKMNGIYNAVSPYPISNKTMVQKINKAHSYNSLVFSVPSFILKLILGEMAAIVLYSSKVSADKIMSAGYVFHFRSFSKAYQDIAERKI